MSFRALAVKVLQMEMMRGRMFRPMGSGCSGMSAMRSRRGWRDAGGDAPGGEEGGADLGDDGCEEGGGEGCFECYGGGGSDV